MGVGVGFGGESGSRPRCHGVGFDVGVGASVRCEPVSLSERV